MVRTYTFNSIIAIAAFLSMAVLVQPSFPHDTSTTEILEELRALREDVNAFLVPADISGSWELGDDVNCSGNLPGWLERALQDAESDDTFSIKQYGNHITMDRTQTDGSITSFPGIIRGDYIRLERDFDFAGSDSLSNWIAGAIGHIHINATVLSTTRISELAPVSTGPPGIALEA